MQKSVETAVGLALQTYGLLLGGEEAEEELAVFQDAICLLARE